MEIIIVNCFFFFKQKTAYDMRISDWSSDVCSSDLDRHAVLETEDNAKPSTGLRRAQVRTGTDLHQMIGQRLNETLIAGDPSQAFLETARRITRGADRLDRKSDV